MLLKTNLLNFAGHMARTSPKTTSIAGGRAQATAHDGRESESSCGQELDLAEAENSGSSLLGMPFMHPPWEWDILPPPFPTL